jgi:acyl carrier protein
METAEIYTEFTKIFRQVFDDDSIALRPDLTANDVEGWDSFSHIRLVLTVEKFFGVKFSASEISKLKNVEGLVDLVRSKVK